MKRKDIKIGKHYTVKVGDKLTVVRIDSVNVHGGWDATSATTSRRIHLKTARRLRVAVRPATHPLLGKEIGGRHWEPELTDAVLASRYRDIISAHKKSHEDGPVAARAKDYLSAYLVSIGNKRLTREQFLANSPHSDQEAAEANWYYLMSTDLRFALLDPPEA